MVTGLTATERKTRWTAVCPLTPRHYIDHQCRGQATLLTAASSPTSDELTNSSRHRPACRRRPHSPTIGTCQTPRPTTWRLSVSSSVGVVSGRVDSRRRSVLRANVEYKTGQREISPVTRDLLTTTRSVLGDIDSCTTASHLQSIQVSLLIIQSRPT